MDGWMGGWVDGWRDVRSLPAILTPCSHMYFSFLSISSLHRRLGACLLCFSFALTQSTKKSLYTSPGEDPSLQRLFASHHSVCSPQAVNEDTWCNGRLVTQRDMFIWPRQCIVFYFNKRLDRGRCLQVPSSCSSANQ